MVRNFTAALMVLALAACTASVGSSPSATTSDVHAPSASAAETEPSASATESPGPTEHPAAGLAFVRFLDPNNPASQVFVVDADGTVRQVTGLSGASTGASHPAWSPDRIQIVFGPPKVGAGLEPQVGIVNADGTGQRDIGEGHRPQWSPDGSRILFEDLDDGSGDPLGIWLFDAATGEQSRIVDGASNARWLPDGERISYHVTVLPPVEGTDGGFEFSEAIHVMSLDGGEPQEFAAVSEAIWSPDGSGVLIVDDDGISLAQADGSGATDLVGGWAPVWSPDGSRILFAYDMSQDALPILAVVDRDGQEVWSGVVGSDPTWSPDGTRVAVEVSYPEPMVQVIDAASGELLWEVEGGSQPAW